MRKHQQKIQSGERQNQPCPVERKSHGNRNNDQRKGSQNEDPAPRGGRVIAPGDGRQFRRRFPTVAMHAKDPFPNPLRKADKTKTIVFRGPKCSTWPPAIAMKQAGWTLWTIGSQCLI